MIRTVPETGSTNADLLAGLAAGERIAEGDWLVANRQITGRGRQARQWFDGQGNFMGSTIVRPEPGTPLLSTLAFVAGLAVYEAVVPLCSDPSALRLKWPNDLLLSGAKLAGILLESAAGAVVVGIGVNLASAPAIEGRETVALGHLGPAPDRDLFARSLAAAFDRELERWRTYGVDPILRRWERIALPPGTKLSVHAHSGVVSGTYSGISAEGSLLLRLADGSTRAIHAGDVMLA